MINPLFRARHSLGGFALRFLRDQRWVWALPVFVALLLRRFPMNTIQSFTSLLVALIVVVLAARAPGRALVVLVCLVPFQLIVLAWLYQAGVPASIVRPMGWWKEAVLAGIVLAGVHRAVVNGDRPDVLDRLAVGYVIAVTAYLVLPSLFSPSAPGNLELRLVAYRADTAFALVFIGARHAALGARHCRTLMRGIF